MKMKISTEEIIVLFMLPGGDQFVTVGIDRRELSDEQYHELMLSEKDEGSPFINVVDIDGEINDYNTHYALRFEPDELQSPGPATKETIDIIKKILTWRIEGRNI